MRLRYALRTKIETKHTITIILDDRTSNEEDGANKKEKNRNYKKSSKQTKFKLFVQVKNIENDGMKNERKKSNR